MPLLPAVGPWGPPGTGRTALSARVAGRERGYVNRHEQRTDRDLRTLLELSAPILSVYRGHQPSARDDPAARAHAITALLAALSATEAQTKIVEDALDAEAEPGSAASALFVGADGTHHGLSLPGSPVPDLVLRADVPHLTPLLAWRQAHPAYVVAMVDRSGADLAVHPGHGAPPVMSSVTGSDDAIERTAPDGRPQDRYQQRAEDSWQHNARLAAHAAVAALELADARILLLGGDIRTVQFFTEALPLRVRSGVTVAHISGGRHSDGFRPHHERQVAEKVARAVEGRTGDLLAELSDLGGPDGRGLDRPSAVIKALSQGRVRTLLVAEAPDRARVAWFGDAPTDIAVHRTELPTRDRPPRRGPLADVAVRAAVLTDADIRILPAGTPGAPLSGIAAVCRF